MRSQIQSLAAFCKREAMANQPFQIHRAIDPEKHVLVYTVVSTRLINGSPFNSISVVPLDVP